MSFGNAYVEGAFWHLLHHDIHRTTCRHGRGNTNYLGILACQFKQRLAEDILETWRTVVVVFYLSFTCLDIEFAWSVPDGDIFFSRGIAVSFLGVQMEQFWTFHVLQLPQDTHQFFDIMTVKRAEITDVHTLENILLVGDGRFQGVGQTNHSASAVIFEVSFSVKPACYLETQGIIGLVGGK